MKYTFYVFLCVSLFASLEDHYAISQDVPVSSGKGGVNVLKAEISCIAPGEIHNCMNSIVFVRGVVSYDENSKGAVSMLHLDNGMSFRCSGIEIFRDKTVVVACVPTEVFIRKRDPEQPSLGGDPSNPYHDIRYVELRFARVLSTAR